MNIWKIFMRSIKCIIGTKTKDMEPVNIAPLLRSMDYADITEKVSIFGLTLKKKRI
jgi:hypothetical protein